MSDPGEPARPVLFAAGGLVAALGAAACCALPLVLGGLGLGTAWLAGIAAFAAPIQPLLVLGALACLAAGGAIAWRRRRACAADPACGRPGVGRVAGIGFLATGALTVAALLAG